MYIVHDTLTYITIMYSNYLIRRTVHPTHYTNYDKNSFWVNIFEIVIYSVCFNKNFANISSCTLYFNKHADGSAKLSKMNLPHPIFFIFFTSHILILYKLKKHV